MQYPTTNKSLLDRIQAEDEVSWYEFYSKYSPIIRYVGTLYHFNETECNDLVQNVMTKFFTYSKSFVYREGEVKFRTYFASIIKSQAVDYIRSNEQQRAKIMMSDSFVLELPFEECFLDEWRKVVLDEAKEELKSRVDTKTYQAFLFYGMQNRPVKQVGEILGMSANQIYLAKNRCTAILQEIVKRYNESDPELKIDL